MLFNAKDYFLVKKAHDGCPKSMLDYYYLYMNTECPSVAMIEDAAGVLKTFLNLYNPHECMKLISAREVYIPDNEYPKSEYIYLINHLAATCLDNGYTEEGVVWARKALDMVDLLYMDLSTSERNDIKSEMHAFVMYNENREYFDNELFEELRFDWERDTIYAVKANDNN